MQQLYDFLVYQLDFLQFLLGTSFFFTALISYVLHDEHDRPSGLRWIWLSFFALTVSFCRITGVFVSPLLPYNIVPIPKFILLLVSNIFLFLFSYSFIQRSKVADGIKLVIAALLGVIVLALFGDILYAYIFAYIMMFLPLSIIAGVAFWEQAEHASGRESFYLRVAGRLIVALGVFLPFPTGINIFGVFLLIAGVAVSGMFCFCLWRILDLKKNTSLFGDAQADKNAAIYMFLSVVSLLIFGFVIINYSGNYAFRMTMSEAEAHYFDVKKSIEYRIEKSDGMVKTLSGSPYILPAVLRGSEQDIDNAYSVLERYRRAMNVSICYLMDDKGIVKASSNKDEKLSFVGKNYSFRPYFSEALQGGQGRLFSKGVTTGIKGYYSSYPVIDKNGVVRGVVVVKEDLSQKDLPQDQMIYLKVKGEEDLFLKSVKAENVFGIGFIGKKVSDLPDREFDSNGKRYVKISESIGATGAEIGLIVPLDLVGYFRMFAIAITFLLVFVAGLGNHFIRKQRYNNIQLKNSNQELMPVLSSIPIIGTLFRRKEVISEKRDLMVLITPHIVTPEFLGKMQQKAAELESKQDKSEPSALDLVR